MSSNIFENIYNEKQNPFTGNNIKKRTFADVDFNNYFNNKTRPVTFRTMIPMCLWVNKKNKLSRIDYPYLNRANGKITCNQDSNIPDWQQSMTEAEKKEWTLYNYWVFNVFNLPPRPAGMNIFQITNKSQPPWNLIGFGNAGILGNPNSLINDAYEWESGIFTILNQNDSSQWRFMTYTQPVPNTKMLYIYDTNVWNVDIKKNTLPNPKNILTSATSKNGTASPVGIDQPGQLYITPERDDSLTLNTIGSAYIWVCEREYTQFICPNSIIIPYSPDIFKKYNFQKTKPLGYLTALAQSTRNMQNWIKYKGGSSNTIRSKLLTLNYNKTTNPIHNKLLIIYGIIIFSIVIVAIFYLFKK
jgi:hypothetical protein